MLEAIVSNPSAREQLHGASTKVVRFEKSWPERACPVLQRRCHSKTECQRFAGFLDFNITVCHCTPPLFPNHENTIKHTQSLNGLLISVCGSIRIYYVNESIQAKLIRCFMHFIKNKKLLFHFQKKTGGSWFTTQVSPHVIATKEPISSQTVILYFLIIFVKEKQCARKGCKQRNCPQDVLPIEVEKAFEREAKYRRAKTIRYAAQWIQKCQQVMCSSAELWKNTFVRFIYLFTSQVIFSKAELLSKAFKSNWAFHY